MNISLKKIEFERLDNGIVPFNTYNLDLLLMYVIPVISNNVGWATEDLNEETFLENPERWRDDIDATVESSLKGEVYIAFDGDKPIGLLEYIVEDFDNLSEQVFSDELNDMLNSIEHKNWIKLIDLGLLEQEILNEYFLELKKYLLGKKFYRSVGVVLIPELQGKRSGVSDMLYEILKNGIILGWTSTPQVIAKRNKMYKKTLFFPLLGESVKDLEELACLLVISARIFARYPETLESFKLGVKTYKGFALRDKEEYMKLSKSFLDKGKITTKDLERLDYILDFKKGQGAILSVS